MKLFGALRRLQTGSKGASDAVTSLSVAVLGDLTHLRTPICFY